MNSILKHISCFLVISIAAITCNDDDIRDPYQPVALSKINQLNFISGNDSSIFIYDADMILTSGRDNTFTGIREYEWFTMEYADTEHKQLSGAEYNVSDDPVTGHRTERRAAYSRDDCNMLAKVTREEWDSKSFSFSYDDRYRLIQLTLNAPNTVNHYTIAYDDQSNVSSVELYQKAARAEGYFKHEFSEYDSKSNPFHFLVNVFYAPVFSSSDGAVFFDKMSSSLGLLLSKNNPGKVVNYTKNENDWEKGGTSTYSYQYGENNYPVGISGNGLSLAVEYK
ncbi:MAG: hypothetical protein LBL24_02155 [Bacteroidales bacterium]|jgi:hypothetical protein|nr:hypothetical protein [Bacteroidales bacterium]